MLVPPCLTIERHSMTARASCQSHNTEIAAAAAVVRCKVAAVNMSISLNRRSGARRARSLRRAQQQHTLIAGRKVEYRSDETIDSRACCSLQLCCCCLVLLQQQPRLCCYCFFSWDSSGGTAVNSAAAGIAGLSLLLVRCLLAGFWFGCFCLPRSSAPLRI